MPLLVANLQNLAEANGQSSGSSDRPRPPREVREGEDAHTRDSTSTSTGRHVDGGAPHTHSGESGTHSCNYQDDPGSNSACDTDPHYLGYPGMGNAARDQHAILWWTTQSAHVVAMQPVLLRAIQLIPTLAMQPIHSWTMQSTPTLAMQPLASRAMQPTLSRILSCIMAMQPTPLWAQQSPPFLPILAWVM